MRMQLGSSFNNNKSNFMRKLSLTLCLALTLSICLAQNERPCITMTTTGNLYGFTLSGAVGTIVTVKYGARGIIRERFPLILPSDKKSSFLDKMADGLDAAAKILGDTTVVPTKVVSTSVVFTIPAQGATPTDVQIYGEEITELTSYSRELSAVDVSNCTTLETLSLSGKLTSLVVRDLPKLVSISCSNNILASLKIDNCALLYYLWCSGNQLTSMDISKCQNLKYLYCEKNQLTSLDIIGFPKLEELICYKNQLTSLDVKSGTQLRKIDCDENRITSLNVKNNVKLKTLKCNSNLLTSIEVGNSISLKKLQCEKNQLSFTSLPQPLERYNYDYAPQTTLALSKATYTVGEPIDLSSQLTAKDATGLLQPTIYCWVDGKDKLLVAGTDYTESVGIFTFLRQIPSAYCKLTNKAFSDLAGRRILKTSVVTIGL